MRIFVLVFGLIFACQSERPNEQIKNKMIGGAQAQCSISDEEKNKILRVVTTDVTTWAAYPTPPLPTCDVLEGVVEEIQVPKSRVLFEAFSKPPPYPPEAIKQTAADQIYILLALSVHGNPDVRVSSTKRIQTLMYAKALTNMTKKGLEKHELKEKAVAKFFLHILDTTPHVIAGRNSTIHRIYISNIKATFQFLTTGKAVTKLR